MPSLYIYNNRVNHQYIILHSRHVITQQNYKLSLLIFSYDKRGKVQSQSVREPKTIVLFNRKTSTSREKSPYTTDKSKLKSTVTLHQWGDEEVWGAQETATSSGSIAVGSIRTSSNELKPTSRSLFPGYGSRQRTRAWFDTDTSPAHLLIRDVSGRDEGSYRCKVHFRHSPSWSQRITLTVKGSFYIFPSVYL